MSHLFHERATRRRINDLRHVLAPNVHNFGSIVLIEEFLDFLDE
jgi:hypothetical protein